MSGLLWLASFVAFSGPTGGPDPNSMMTAPTWVDVGELRPTRVADDDKEKKKKKEKKRETQPCAGGSDIMQATGGNDRPMCRISTPIQATQIVRR